MYIEKRVPPQELNSIISMTNQSEQLCRDFVFPYLFQSYFFEKFSITCYDFLKN